MPACWQACGSSTRRTSAGCALVVQGARDPFGLRPAGPRREVVVVPSDHALKKDFDTVGTAVARWLPRTLGT